MLYLLAAASFLFSRHHHPHLRHHPFSSSVYWLIVVLPLPIYILQSATCNKTWEHHSEDIGEGIRSLPRDLNQT